ncbi:hypothetical protein [Variovorax sp. J31P207]|uniref:hypothetical protein n=1 Tax=Variovorax sp. J31P207 TaxID=3053510 RepID=UPI0025750057|nr:hypothetical protein [Variovorax sp. J31P207]MDM0065992.1 hypothetical protein [Variovorax sp. J31P207]
MLSGAAAAGPAGLQLDPQIVCLVFSILFTGLGYSVAKKKTAVVINKNGKKAGDPIALDGAAPLKIKALPNVKYLLKGEGDVGPENATLTRVGDDLHVTLEGEASPALVLEGFYALAEPSGIYGVAEDGQLYAYGFGQDVVL